MLMKRIVLIIAFAVSFLCRVSAQFTVYEVYSPDKRICFRLNADMLGKLIYKVSVDGKDIIGWSELGYTQASDDVCSPYDLQPTSKTPYIVKDVWKPLWGKRSKVQNVYNTWSFSAVSTTGQDDIDVRVYNDGVAFKISTLTNYYEHTKFNFAGDYTAWYYNGERHNIGPEKLSEANGERLPVMIIKAADALLYLII